MILNTKKQRNKYFTDLYKKFGAKTIKQKIKVIEEKNEMKEGTYNISHFKYNSKEWLKAVEFFYLVENNLIKVIDC